MGEIEQRTAIRWTERRGCGCSRRSGPPVVTSVARLRKARKIGVRKSGPEKSGPLLWDFDRRYLMVIETPVEVDAE